MLSEFEGVGKQVLQYLLQTLGIGHQATRQIGVRIDFKGELLVFSFMAEWPCNHFQYASKEQLFCFNRDRTRFNLRQVKDVADQVEQVSSSAMNGSGKLNLLAGKVAFWIVSQLLTK